MFSSLGSNEEITLNCVFDGFPVPRVRFHKYGVELNSSGITYGPGSATYKLSVSSQSDFGFYTCKATNNRGSASHYIEVYEPGMWIMVFVFQSKPKSPGEEGGGKGYY